ncbi:MAG: hydroxymethylglutaryl-CoA lyase [Aestuariivita sp.]|nr:hydroxymethylglutaryl-CoA lyase [Aestuariivita sp.]MCY4201722.1 hydroxymethylglutaryl-CoA lyase [Aestuariivita sp.]
MDTFEIFEVGPRDGLQNETTSIALADKVRFIDYLSAAGFRRIECGSFVNPTLVPQMADSAAVFAAISRRPAISYAALTPNMQGFKAAVAARVDEVAIFASASEGFSQKNINATIEESFERFKPVIEAAKRYGIVVRGYVSCVTDCPYDGCIDPEQAAKVAARLYSMGCYEISLGDTIGKGTPERISRMIATVAEQVPIEKLAGHYHDTDGQALANISASVALGMRVFDASVGGLGGCPFAPGAKGNVATEAAVRHLLAAGFESDLDLEVLDQSADFARKLCGKPNGSPVSLE